MSKYITLNGETYKRIDDIEGEEDKSEYYNVAYVDNVKEIEGEEDKSEYYNVAYVDNVKEEKPSLYPEKDEIYFCLNKKGTSVKHRDKGKIRGPKPADIGNYFKNREGANKKGKELRAIHRVKSYIARNLGYHPEKWANWNDRNQDKYNVYFDGEIGDEGMAVSWSLTAKEYSPIGYLKTREQAEQLIKDKKEDLETIYKPK